MKNKILIFSLLAFLYSLFSVYTVQAAVLDVTSYPLNISQKANSTLSFPVTIVNNFNNTIYNITLESQYFTMPVVPSMVAYTNQSATVSFLADKILIADIPLKFRFDYIEQTIVPPSVVSVGITVNSFTNTSLRLIKSSTVTYNNIDTLIHRINESAHSLFFSGDIMPNTSFSFVFSNINNYTVAEPFLGFSQQVEIVDNLQFVPTHNAQYDKSFSISARTYLQNTSLQLSLMSTNISMDYNKTAENILTIKNVGTETAYNIRLQGSWSTFGKTGFNLDPQQQTYVVMVVTPSITSSSQTNQTYVKDILIDTDNAGNYTLQQSIFLNYVPIVLGESINTSDIDSVLAWLSVFCINNPYSALCNATKIIKENVTVYEMPSGSLNFTGLQMTDFLTRLAMIESESRVAANEMKAQLDNITDRMEKIENKSTYTADKFGNFLGNEESGKKRWYIILILVVILLFTGTFVLLYYTVIRKKKRGPISDIK